MIPDEIREFFSVGGRILLIKGNAGTGKTLLGIQLLKELDHLGEGIWVHSRNLDFSERSELEAITPKRRRMDASRPQRKLSKKEDQMETPATQEPVSEQDIIMQIYQEIQKIKDPPIIVIDSFEGLTTGMEGAKKDALKLGLVSLARETKANIALIMETFEPNPLDYLADGVVTLREQVIEDRRVRTIHLNKLRGTLIGKPQYLFTLANGNFRYFLPSELDVILKPFDLEIVPDTEGHISSGSKNIDSVTGGGLRIGGSFFYEVDSKIPNYIHLANFIVPVLSNHLNQDKGLIFIPPDLRNVGTLLGLLQSYVSKERLDNNFASLCLETEEIGYMCRTCSAKGENLADDIKPLLEVRDEFQEKGPVITLLVADSLEQIYGVKESVPEIIDMMTNARTKGNVLFIVGRDISEISTRLTHFVDVHWRVRGLHDTFLLYGVYPRSEFFIFTTVSINGSNIPNLVPLV